MNSNVQDLMKTMLKDATRLTQGGQLQEATQAIQRALSGSLPGTYGAPSTPASTRASADQMVIDGCVFETGGETATEQREPATQSAFEPDTFISGSFTNAAGTRTYKLYIPPGGLAASEKPLPLVVMLHGCTQNPDDFAAGTGMNALARERGYFVLYPAQAQSANTSGCWNWFKHNHQARGRGEPSLLAGMTQAAMADHGIDPQRVYVAGLSAGGAMAAVLATAYPDIYAAAGVHSGLPVGVARDMMGALALMKDGRAQGTPSTKRREPLAGVTTPIIVFHGDHDQTVHPRNGEQVISATLARADVTEQVLQGQATRGRRYTRRIYANDHGHSIAEHWQVQGAGHAWAGGSARGSYTDPQGPDASSEMLRFFQEHPLRRHNV